jgi:polyvinyl alcohol dehydrogenase (cytochrome)
MAAVMGAGLLVATDALAADWPSAGADLSNSRYQSQESRIKANTVGSLVLKWTFATKGDVQAHPAVDGDYLYFPDSAGWLYKVDKKTGAPVWQRKISDYTGFTDDSARGTPAVAGNLLILGNLIGRNTPLFGQSPPPPQPARVFAVDKVTGDPVWSTKVDETDLAFVTTSPIVYNNTAYVGVSANEELISAFVPKSNWVWTFRGSVVALDVTTGTIKWQTFMIPARPANHVGNWYSGAGIWGSTGAIDKANNQIFMASGNNTSAPQSVVDCLRAGQPPSSCVDPADHFDSVVALDLNTGKINWARRGLPNDIYAVACGLTIPGVFSIPFPPPLDFLTPGAYDNCPWVNPPPDQALPPIKTDPDWDFAQGPMLLDDDLVGAGQKSGVFWAFKRKTGQLVWSTQVVPGGITGGMQWGSATDGRWIYVASSNSGTAKAGAGSGAMPWTLKNGTVTKAGGWAMMDGKNGHVIWTTKDPQDSRAEGAVSATNDVVFGCNLSATGRMFAMRAMTGQVLWSFDSSAPCNAGASISDGMVYWGSGTFSGSGPRNVFAFGLP